MQKKMFFLSLGLILLALCSCDKSVQTDADVTMAKARKHAMVQPSELGNFVVNPDLDAEFQVSEAEIVEELITDGFLDASESVCITPIYSERIIPLFFKSLIVEPESNEWYGINVDEVMNMYMEFPSIAFYIINTATEKSFLTTADKRYGSNLINYREPFVLEPEIIDIYEEVVDMLYAEGVSASFKKFDSITLELVHDAFGVPRQHDDLFNLKMYMAMFHMQKWASLDGEAIRCDGLSVLHTAGPILTEDYRWGQYDIFGDCDHDLSSGSIAISILKILCLHGYSGILFGEYFDGAACRTDMDQLSHFGWLLYDEIQSAAECDRTERGLRILSNICGYRLYVTDGRDMQRVRLCVDAGRLVIIPTSNGHWRLIDGYQVVETTCDDIVHTYSVDKNRCDALTADWGNPFPLYNIYSYELY